MPGGGAGAWKPSHNPWLVAISVMIATFMEVMDTSIASVAVPYIAGSTASTTDEAEWVLTVYLVANAVFLPSSTWFSERFGRKRFLMMSIIVFTIASFACGIAPNLPIILLARIIQGAGGGALQPLAQSILVESFPPEKRGQAMGLYALGVVVAPVVGPVLGGYLTNAISWRWAFYINVPVGILAILLQSRFLEDPPYVKNAKPGKLDSMGFGLLGIWIACMQFVLDKGQEDDWFGNASIRWATLVGVICLIAFVVRELAHDKPLVDLRALGNRNLAIGCCLIFVLGAGIYSLTSILPVFYQTLLGYDASAAGIAVSPRGLGSIVAAIAVSVMAAKVDPRRIVALGFSVFAVAALWTSLLTLQISPTSLFWPITISGAAMSMTFVPLSNVSLGTVPQAQVSNASGLFNFVRNVGGSVGISAANTIAQRHLQTHRSDMIHWLSGASWLLHKQLEMLTMQMHLHTGPKVSMLRAMFLIQSALNKQAQLWAYVDVFRYLALACAICVPLTFFFKKATGQSDAS
jgi:DHA2 family multidrug resistance protein